jgi:Male sterility protein
MFYFSLNSTYIRAALVRAFISVGRDSPNIPETIVYVHPTVQALSNWLWKELTGTSGPAGSDTDLEASVAGMKDMISGQLDTLANDIRASRQTRMNGTSEAVPSSQDVKNAVLVTGTTGALGAYLLETLLVDPSVDEVIALNRHSRSVQAEGGGVRQQTAFDKRGINQDLLGSRKLTFIDADRIQDIERDVISRVCNSRHFLSYNATIVLC